MRPPAADQKNARTATYMKPARAMKKCHDFAECSQEPSRLDAWPDTEHLAQDVSRPASKLLFASSL